MAKETWKNLSHQMKVAPSINFRGEMSQRVIQPGRVFEISTEERQHYQGQVADAKDDEFMNGTFDAVKLVDSAEDYEIIANAPDRFSDDDLRDMIKGQAMTVAKRVAEIDNPVTLSRLIKLAEEADVSKSKLDVLSDRHGELTAVVNDPLDDAPDMD